MASVFVSRPFGWNRASLQPIGRHVVDEIDDQNGATCQLVEKASNLWIGWHIEWENGSNQRLATLREPHRPILSRVRCIAWFGVRGLQQVPIRL
jgi:hypothetical protein